ncbi:GMC oxidoreductase [Periconia macrospinosa]|uniref:GMC oxidoreductase n=1 Tax=Periconia macrospinosa TaxID=97972 RepID=A0A2V1DEZ3_9PLEO|nr:GMC oxidoreductase [Periconia macrospinosa]
MRTTAPMESAYDYVIICGGTAGLVLQLANRLSENSENTVLVIEAGEGATADPRMIVPGLFPSALTSELNWNFATVPQVRLDGRCIGHYQGKALGGSSAINAQALIPFRASDIDAWEKLVWDSAFASLGYPLTASPFSGKPSGPYIAPSTVVCCNCPLCPSGSQRNLRVLTGAVVNKIILGKRDGKQAAIGVPYAIAGTILTTRANNEIILSAGVFNSPKTFELRGIGDPKVLKVAGAPCLVDNKYIGTNLQDHIQAGISFEAVDGFPTGDHLLRGDSAAISAAQQQYAKNQSGPLASSGVTEFAYIPTVDFKSDTAKSHHMEDLKSAAPTHPLDAARVERLIDLIENGDEGTSRQLHHPLCGTFASTIHWFRITSLDVNDPPAIDRKYLSTPLISTFTPPNGKRNDPLAFINGSLDRAKSYAKAASTTYWHSVSTVAMAPQDKGGIVDNSLKIYGVSGLRVFDASVFPLIPLGNTQSPVYSLAERAVDLIKQE